MTALDVTAPVRSPALPGAMLVAGVVLAALAEAIASTALSLGRGDAIGDTHATPDEFAWLDISYIALKLIGFVLAPWLIARIGPIRLLLASTLAVGAACVLTPMTSWLELLAVLRAIQGLAGGLLLVSGQAIIFLAYPRAQQPILQALFAIGAVVAPATIAPALQGWLIDTQSWGWIFFAVFPVALAASGALLIAGEPAIPTGAPRPFDWLGLILISIALSALTFVFSQGSRWDWFESPRIIFATVLGAGSLAAFAVQQASAKGRGLIDWRVFGSQDFAFAFVVSFVAGAALFGSAFLIPAFAVSVLSFTPTAAGMLLAPSGGVFIGALLFAAYLVQVRGAPAIAAAPFGILAIMAAMWMLGGSTQESGAADMAPALLLRGLGLGFLFLAITLIAFLDLDARRLASGIGLFNAGRQLGGLMGVAWLQSGIDHNIATSLAALSANLATGSAAANERLAALGAYFVSEGLDAAAASRAAGAMLGQSVRIQASVIAFDTAFYSLALLFVVAAPIVIGVKVGLSRFLRSVA
jgi:MFS transporter, DHA2 family, multidrug resistance protein